MSSMVGEEGVLAQAIMSIKAIIKLDPLEHETVIIQLVRSLDSIKVPSARAMIVWMVGEYNSVGQIIPRMLATVLKYLAGCFASEALETKHQILSTSVKILLNATGDDSSTFRKALRYILQLSKCDLNYDLRDRARLVEKLSSFHLSTDGMENGSQHVPQNRDSEHTIAKKIFSVRAENTVAPQNSFRFYLPGSLSQIVLHAAPGYEPLPRPGSLDADDIVQQIDNNRAVWEKASSRESSKTSNGSLGEESGSSYSSRHSVTSSIMSDEANSASGTDEEADPLIQLLDSVKPNGNSEENSSMLDSENMGGLMSKRALESWLDGNPDVPVASSTKETLSGPSPGIISLKDISSVVNRKIYTLLDRMQGNGLKVEYSFSSDVSSISQSLICVELSFENCSTEPFTAITLINEDSQQSRESTNSASETYKRSSAFSDIPAVVPMEEIASIEPGQTAKTTLHIHFPHHLLPLKMVVCSNERKYSVKLRPDIGYFVKPLPMDIETFKHKESQLPGMFEYTRSCTFADHVTEINSEDLNAPMRDNLLIVCRTLTSKILSNANISLVSVDMPVTANFDDASGLCFRFSGEILSNMVPCLVSITVEGKCSAALNVSTKVNCEETIFGLNLLNRIVAILS